MRSLAEFTVYAVLPATDYGRARAWYEAKLGMTPSEETPGEPHAWYRCGDGTWFILTQTPSAGTAQNTAAGFSVKDIVSVMDDLRSRGVEFFEYDFGEMGKTESGLMTMGPYKAAWFKDSEGNIVELSEVG
jgi:catechol 2,3-dioxygenase-like lactoylglutathione lyase family enzyme